jgi:hypothetical protein
VLAAVAMMMWGRCRARGPVEKPPPTAEIMFGDNHLLVRAVRP